MGTIQNSINSMIGAAASATKTAMGAGDNSESKELKAAKTAFKRLNDIKEAKKKLKFELDKEDEQTGGNNNG